MVSSWFRFALVAPMLSSMCQTILAEDKAVPPPSQQIQVPKDTPDNLKVKGTMLTIKGFASKNLNNMHNIDVYLPPGYDANGETRYPVLYTIGWNTLYISGGCDGIPAGTISKDNDSIVSMLREGTIRPFIMISVSPDLDPKVNLMDECAPTRVSRTRRGQEGDSKPSVAGGKVHLFAKFMIEEVKPYVDSHYRTLSGPKTTGITGISKWGMGTMYIAMNHPDVFGMVGAMSPAVGWDSMVLAHILDALPEPLPLRVWMSAGEQEGHYLDDMSLFKRLFLSKGIPAKDVEVLVVKGGNHSGATWGPSVGPMLKFMFPPVTEQKATDAVTSSKGPTKEE